VLKAPLNANQPTTLSEVFTQCNMRFATYITILIMLGVCPNHSVFVFKHY